MEGLLLFDKPKGWTSHDVVGFIRSRLKVKKAGHAGTLDPMATGLLLILLGSWTKRSDRLMGLDKDYSGTIQLGVETDTLDMEGQVLRTSDLLSVTAERIGSVLQSFQGDISLIPPAYSAIKKAGKKAYELARAGVAVEMEPRQVRIENIQFERYTSPQVYFSLTCSKGTYVRSIAALLGQKLGCGGALSSLVRTRIGPYRLEEAIGETDIRTGDLEAIGKGLILS